MARAIPSASRRAAETRALIELRRALVPARPSKRLPRQVFPITLQRDYAADLVRRVRQAREFLRPLLDALPQLFADAMAERRLDAGEGARIRRMIAEATERMRATIRPDDIEDLARSGALRIASFQKRQLDRQIKAAFGVDVFIRDEKLAAIMDGFVAENVSLIVDLPTKMYSDIEKTVARGITSGITHKDISKDLRRQFGFAEDRAKLIARDQVGKFYGQVNEARQRELGVRRFIWRTVGDERVRAEHEDRNGNVYSYDDPPGGQLPGEPVLCRCYAEPVLADILGE